VKILILGVTGMLAAAIFNVLSNTPDLFFWGGATFEIPITYFTQHRPINLGGF